MRLAVLGASGFVGSSVVRSARAANIECVGLGGFRVSASSTSDARRGAASWRVANPVVFDRLCRDLGSVDVVVNAAGLAKPTEVDRGALHAANVIQPTVVAQACAASGVRRLVHVSTAAVQGRLDPLDETTRWFPLSPYAESKAEAERLLLDGRQGWAALPPEVVVYRPTSVHGPGRQPTRRLAQLASVLPALPLVGRGDQPLPVAHIENVGAGLVFAARSARIGPIVLQPWEGMTARELLEVFGARKFVSLPASAAGRAPKVLARSRAPRVTARVRWLELVWLGQGQKAERLSASGFKPQAGRNAWLTLAAHERAQLGSASGRRGT